MFGYIVPAVPEMKVREFERYRQYYCGLCRALKERYGNTGILNYDATFVYLLGDSLIDSAQPPEKVRCVLHPIKGLPAISTPMAQYAADVNALMGFAKAADDVKDGGGTAARLRAFSTRRLKGKVREHIPGVVHAMDSCLADLDKIETEQCSQIDAAAEPYGRLFAEVLSNLDILQSHILSELGYNIGRWVYLIDAWDDLGQDQESGAYNVFRTIMKETSQSQDELKQSVSFSMFFTLSQAAGALSRLELKKNQAILDNVVRLGLHAQTRSVLAGEGRVTYESLRSTRRS